MPLAVGDDGSAGDGAAVDFQAEIAVDGAAVVLGAEDPLLKAGASASTPGHDDLVFLLDARSVTNWLIAVAGGLNPCGDSADPAAEDSLESDGLGIIASTANSERIDNLARGTRREAGPTEESQVIAVGGLVEQSACGIVERPVGQQAGLAQR